MKKTGAGAVSARTDAALVALYNISVLFNAGKVKTESEIEIDIYRESAYLRLFGYQALGSGDGDTW